ncbi:MAG: amidase family protein, partial [Terriglobia bacterium]
MELRELTIGGLQEQLRARALTARQVAEQHLASIEERNRALGAFLTLCPERALAQADAIDQRVERGEALPPLAGVPVGVKDVIVTRGVPTTAGSRILENYRPPYDATAVA